jgi:RNA polymerase sigma-70 factor (ECF subfamily)
LDPSDVVQETLADADRKLDDYLKDMPIPFFPWLRQLAWERLTKLHRAHLHSGKRAIGREEGQGLLVSDESINEFSAFLVASGTGPSQKLLRAELKLRVRAGLEQLAERDREVLVMRYLEGLSNAEIAASLGISVGAVRVRHTRALDRLHSQLFDLGENH